MVAVVAGHLRTLTADVLHTVVVSSVKILQFALQVITFVDKFLCDAPYVLNLGTIMQSCATEICDLLL